MTPEQVTELLRHLQEIKTALVLLANRVLPQQRMTTSTP